MNHFFSDNIVANSGSLNAEDSHHASRVLRLKEGDQISVSPGDGQVYLAQIKSLHKSATKFEIQSLRRIQSESKLHIGIAPTKSNDRFEIALEKLSEFGVNTIYPIICDHSERKIYKTERGQRIIEAACKQSHKGFLPKLDENLKFENLVARKDLPQKRFIAALAEGTNNSLSDINFREECLVLIGPEGDFSPKEVKLAQEHGFEILNLGSEVLRTETAAISVAAIANYHSL